MLDQITPLILTHNEAPNIGRTLERVRWAKRVVVVDSLSIDDTEAICRSLPQVDFIPRQFDDHTSQWNFGLDQIRTAWVLAMDADYILTDEFNTELTRWAPAAGTAAYFARFRYYVAGRRLRASLYPPRAVLFRPSQCRYRPDGHTQLLSINGGTASLTASIDHDDRKPLADWLRAQDRYAALEAGKLLIAAPGTLALQDRIRRLIVAAPLLVPAYALLVKGLVFEGWPGWYYALQRALAELILSLRLIEARLSRGPL